MLTEEELVRLNELLNEYVSVNMIEEDNSKNYNVFVYSMQLIKIFDKYYKFKDELDVRKKEKIEDSINLAKLFLNEINPEYVTYLEDKITKKEIEFIKMNDEDDSIPNSSYSDYQDGVNKIVIVYEETFEDVYSIIHELLHDTNLLTEYTEEDDYKFETRSMYTELVSYLGTLLARDYYKKICPKKEIDEEFNIANNSLFCRRFQLEFTIYLIMTFCKKGMITNYDIHEVLEDVSPLYKAAVEEYFEFIKEEDSLLYFFNERYLTAGILSNYILNTYEDNMTILRELNELITSVDKAAILEYLDLDAIIDDEKRNVYLADSAITKIENSFKKKEKQKKKV